MSLFRSPRPRTCVSPLIPIIQKTTIFWQYRNISITVVTLDTIKAFAHWAHYPAKFVMHRDLAHWIHCILSMWFTFLFQTSEKERSGVVGACGPSMLLLEPPAPEQLVSDPRDEFGCWRKKHIKISVSVKACQNLCCFGPWSCCCFLLSCPLFVF